MKMDLTGLIYLLFSMTITGLGLLLWGFTWVMILTVGYVQCQWQKWKGSSLPREGNLGNPNRLIYIAGFCPWTFQTVGKSTCLERKCLNSGNDPVIAIFSIANVPEKVRGCEYVMQGHSFNVHSSRQLTHRRGKHQLYLMMNMN